MKNRSFTIIDSTGHPVRRFSTYKQAETFRIAACRHDWKIINCSIF